jgi:ferredoxin-NADP reductase
VTIEPTTPLPGPETPAEREVPDDVGPAAVSAGDPERVPDGAPVPTGEPGRPAAADDAERDLRIGGTPQDGSGAPARASRPPAADEEAPAGPGGRARVDWRLATVVSTERETPRSTTLVLDVPEWPGHRAGQHVDVRLTAEDGYQAQRSYSIASAPEDQELRITVDRLEDGEVSPFLVDDVLAGDQLELRGPIGGPFTWSVDDGGPLLLLAGGSGIVPLMAMLRHRAAQGSEVPARLLHSVRAPREALFRRELLALSSPMTAAGPGTATLDVHWTYTRMAPPDWDGFSGRVDGAMLDAVERTPVAGSSDADGRPAPVALFGAPAPGAGPAQASSDPAHGSDTRAFVCGPTGFVEAVSGLLVDRGHDPSRVHTERFGPS